MPGFYTITYPASGETGKYAGMRGNYYEFPDGATINVTSRPVWCCSCVAVTDGEYIESIEQLRQELLDLDDPDSWLYKFHEGSEEIAQIPGVPRGRIGFREKAIERTNERLSWRITRESKPKCLICGSQEIAYPDDEGNVTIDGIIVVRIESSGMCSTSFNNWFFTPEGVRIPRDTKPSYWQIPSE